MDNKPIQRRLVAVLAADVAGYTRLMEQDTDGTVAAWQAAQQEVIKPTVADHSGKIVKLTGDGFLVEFSTVRDAVNCAIAMQRGLASSSLDFRIGVHMGDIVDDGEDIHGEGVNVAARLEGLADPGGICISGDVYNQIRNRVDAVWEDMGRQEVKNVSAPVQVYAVRFDSPDAPSASGAPAISDKPSIAVLAFDNMSGDPEQEYFSDGITDDIITALSAVHSFFVIARNSSFAYKGRTVDVKTIGRELGVQYVLEGSVRKAGNRIRVTAQLIEAATGSHVWADRFDGTPDDIFDLQDEITASVVGALQPELVRAEAKRIKQKRPENLDAYDYTLRGLAHMDLVNPEDSLKAFELFLKAIEIDPGYARAYASASWHYRRQVQIHGMVLSEEEQAECIRLAELALKSDPADPYVLYQVALSVGWVGGNLERGLEMAEQALAINSNSTRIWLTRSTFQNLLGNPEAAIESVERAIRLSPNEPAMWVAHGELSKAHIQLADYEAALGWARRSVEKHPDNWPAHHVLIASLAQLDHMDEAKTALNRLEKLDPGLTIKRLLENFSLSRYRNLDGLLDGLRKAGLPE
ncbi:MAG: hypothetical protein IH994_04555 [Proteobacteria bacterium]|nr:hypothetical protein [Pseudomonadota bacterium]